MVLTFKKHEAAAAGRGRPLGVPVRRRARTQSRRVASETKSKDAL